MFQMASKNSMLFLSGLAIHICICSLASPAAATQAGPQAPRMRGAAQQRVEAVEPVVVGDGFSVAAANASVWDVSSNGASNLADAVSQVAHTSRVAVSTVVEAVMDADSALLDDTAGMLDLQGSSSELQPPTDIFTIALDKQYVPVTKNNVTVMYKTAYFGTIFVGSPKPQPFSMLFDTGSGHFFIPSENCQEAACRQRRQYRRNDSSSAVDIDHDGNSIPQETDEAERDKVAIEYGTGEVEGDFVYEMACLKNHTGEPDFSQEHDCVNLRIITTTSMSNEPFHAFAFDGVVGLGLASLAVHPEFSFFGQVAKMNRLQQLQFGVFLSGDDAIPSEISFGGHDARRVAHELSWAPVFQPEQGYWQIKMNRVIVGGEPFALCEEGDCIAIVDTGTSLLGVPKPELTNFHWLLARKVVDQSQDIDCREFPGPEISFLFDGFNISVGPKDYSRPSALRIENSKTNSTEVICRASLLPVDMPEQVGGTGQKTWILGEPVLRKYYTTYDWALQQVGFATAVPPPPSALKRHSIIGQPLATESRQPSVVKV
mmetsp:Transcript_99554/g.172828  ORF Transcript_99554/g.172828 Transcript_99554/m.172828 type:complete len:544 (-) Transcript_99554:46-1677(-)